MPNLKKIQLDDLVIFKMLQNAYLLAKIGADTAENERNFAEILPEIGNYPYGLAPARACRPSRRRRRRGRPGRAPRSARPPPRRVSEIGKFAKCLQNLQKNLAGSFSAVSKRNFAIKYAFDNIFQALQDLHPFAPLQSQNFRKKSV